MFKDIYAVCVKTIIDGCVPSYYAVAMCETEKDALIIKEFVDSCINTLNNTDESIRRHNDAEMLIHDVVDWEQIKFGYSEGIYGNTSYIQKIKMIADGNGKGLPTHLNRCLRNYKQKMRKGG